MLGATILTSQFQHVVRAVVGSNSVSGSGSVMKIEGLYQDGFPDNVVEVGGASVVFAGGVF